MSPRYHACVQSCGKKWQKLGPFHQHQRTCEHWRAHEQRMQRQRAEEAARLRPKKRKKTSTKKVFTVVVFCGVNSINNSRETGQARPPLNLTLTSIYQGRIRMQHLQNPPPDRLVEPDGLQHNSRTSSLNPLNLFRNAVSPPST